MSKFTLLKLVLIVTLAVSSSGCLITNAVKKKADGYTETVRNENPPPDFHRVVHEPQPAYLFLILLTSPADVATLPFQAIWAIYYLSKHGF